jgi:hypothetical protein
MEIHTVSSHLRLVSVIFSLLSVREIANLLFILYSKQALTTGSVLEGEVEDYCNLKRNPNTQRP